MASCIAVDPESCEARKSSFCPFHLPGAFFSSLFPAWWEWAKEIYAIFKILFISKCASNVAHFFSFWLLSIRQMEVNFSLWKIVGLELESFERDVESLEQNVKFRKFSWNLCARRCKRQTQNFHKVVAKQSEKFLWTSWLVFFFEDRTNDFYVWCWKQHGREFMTIAIKFNDISALSFLCNSNSSVLVIDSWNFALVF